MRLLLFLLIMLFVTEGFGQVSCCSATAQFADLGEETEFRNSHMEPLAASPVEEGQWISFATRGDQQGRAFEVITNAESNHFLFVFHEWWGLNEHIQQEAVKWSQKLSDVNVLAIDLYDGKVASSREAASDLMQTADEARIREVIEGAINHVGKGAKVATVGWCFGGGWSMQAALMLGEQAQACVVYYGMPEKDAKRLEQLSAPVLGIFAEKDEWINHEVVNAYENAMDQADKSYSTQWFDANHAFANPSNPVFDEEAAMTAGKLTTEFLNEYLK